MASGCRSGSVLRLMYGGLSGLASQDWSRGWFEWVEGD